MEETMYLPEGTLLQGGKYKIIRYISSGGFGCTYEAVHQILPLRYAIKEFFVKDFCNRDLNHEVSVGTKSKTALVDKLKKKFIEEARALCEFNHPGIVKASDVVFENGTVYFVMDYIDGPSLSQIQKQKGRIPEKEAVEYIRQVADALAYVHSHNRLHLDIKPGNILINKEGKAVLIDFGASKQYDEADGANTSTLIGNTPGFAPPEQMGNDVVRFLPATDVYALGATLYKLITGNTPPSAMMISSGEEVPPIPPELASEQVRNAIDKAMTINKHKRPQSMQEFMALIDAPAANPSQPEANDGGKPEENEVIAEPEKPRKKKAPKPERRQDKYSDQRSATPPAAQPPVPPAIQESPKVAEPVVAEPIVPEQPEPVEYVEESKAGVPRWLYGVLALAVAVLALIVFWPDKKDKDTNGDETVEMVEKPEVTDVKDMEYTNSQGVKFTYTGNVKSDADGNLVPHGTGTGIYPHGTYTGPYVDGLRVGDKAVYDTKDKTNHFEGSFADDAYDQGKLTYTSDGSYYKGTFRYNHFYSGVYYNPDGTPQAKIVKGQAVGL